MAPPAFSDISKPSNDLLTKDFPLSAAKLDFKSKAPNGVAFNVKGQSSHEGATSSSIEAKYADASAGKPPSLSLLVSGDVPGDLATPITFAYYGSIKATSLLIKLHRAGLTITEIWTTANVLTTKVELDNNIAKGLKAEAITDFKPVDKNLAAKFNLHFKQDNFHGRIFSNLLQGPTANIDAVLGHEGFLVGAEAAYDVQKAAITKYSTAIGYTAPEWSAAITATNSLSVFAASYYHKVNSQVEAGAKAVWDSKSSNNVAMELASKWRLDPSSFAKAKINDRGTAALAYSVKLRPGVTVGLGLQLDTQALNGSSSAHKIGTSLELEG